MLNITFPRVTRTHTIDLSPKESALLDQMAQGLGISVEAVLRQSFRFYQMRHAMACDGWPVVRFANQKGDLKPLDMPLGCGGDD